MSRLARKPLMLPAGVELKVNDKEVQIKGKKGSFTHALHASVRVEVAGNLVMIQPKASAKKARGLKTGINPMIGTTCKLLGNMVKGVHEGFERKLSLVGVGYRAKIQGKSLELSLGYSNPVLFTVPDGIVIEVPSNTEIIIKGIDRQLVGETAAQIRAIRPPEYYKGKGVRYADEKITLKETKKK